MSEQESSSILIIANNPKGKYQNKKLLELISPQDKIVGLNTLDWYYPSFPIHHWFCRLLGSHYAGFDSQNLPLKPKVLPQLQSLTFINGKKPMLTKTIHNLPQPHPKPQVIPARPIIKKYQLSKQPSTGFMALEYFLTHHPKLHIKLINFTFKGNHAHSWREEKRICRKLAKKGKITILK